MENSQQLAHRFREVTLNGKWIAFTNIQQQLEDVNWEQATTQISSLNTLAKLTFHLDYYIEGLVQFFNGGELTIRDKYSFDMPPLTSEGDWEKLRARFLHNSEQFAQSVEAMSDEQLDSVFIAEQYFTYRRNIEGMIEHCYYHFGQISLIKKMVLEQK